MKVSSVLWWEITCNFSSKFLLYEGKQVAAHTGYFTGRIGRHCDGEIIPFTHGFNNVLADEIITSNAWGGGRGGNVIGTTAIPGSKSVSSSEGVVVLKSLRNLGGLPRGTYGLQYNKSDGILAWYGNATSTIFSDGTSTTSNNQSYLLACVDFDKNNICDFLQDI